MQRETRPNKKSGRMTKPEKGPGKRKGRQDKPSGTEIYGACIRGRGVIRIQVRVQKGKEEYTDIKNKHIRSIIYFYVIFVSMQICTVCLFVIT